MATKVDNLQLEITASSSKASKQIDKLATSLANLKNVGNLSSVTKDLKKLNSTLDGLGSSSKKTMSNLLNFAGATYTLNKVTDAIAKSVDNINNYIETMNLFQVSMGEFYKDANDYAQLVSDKMGIDVSEWQKAQGEFMSMTQGFGVATDMAYEMSKGLTEVAYDLSSFINIPVEEALTKIRSGLSGEIEPLRNVGFALSQASLQELAYTKGITKKVNAMSEAEKSQLRYVAIVEQATKRGMIGDFAKTLESPANAMRILKQQVTQLSRALGSVFLPIIAQILPYVQAFVKVLTDALKTLATLMGFKMPEWGNSDWGANSFASGVASADESLGSASKKAKEIKKALMGFDELNIIPSPTDTASGGGSGISTGGDLGLDIASVWKESDIRAISTQIDEIVAKFKGLGEVAKEVGIIIGGIALGFLAWKGISTLAMGFGSGFGIIKSAVETVYLYFLYFVDGVKLGFGAISGAFLPAVVVITAVASVVYALYKNWDKVVDVLKTFTKKIKLEEKFKDIKKAAKPLLDSIAGLGDIFEFVGEVILMVLQPAFAVIGGLFNAVISTIAPLITMVKGVIQVFESLGKFLIGVFTGNLKMVEDSCYNLWKGINDAFFGGIKVVVEFVKGFVDGVIGWFESLFDVLVGHSIVPDLVDAVINCFKEMINKVIKSVKDFVNNVINTFTTMYNNVVKVASNCWTGIKNVFSSVGNWFKTYVTQPVGNFFSTLWNGVKNTAINSWNGIKNTFATISNWINTIVIKPVANFFTGLWNTVKTKAVDSWNGIKNTFSAVGSWMNNNIVKPVGNYFSNMWNGFVNAGKNAWNSIKSVFSSVGTFFKNTFTNAWNGVVKVFNVGGQIFTNIKNGIVSSFKSIVNQLITGINSVVKIPFDGINSALRIVRDISIFGLKPFKNLIKTISVPQIPMLASGGMVDTGQMFIARESGPELVGQIGGQTAVANNTQIIEGISQGVYEAVVRAMSSSGGNNSFNANIVVELDGNQVGKSVVKYHNDKVIQTGTSPLMI